MPRVSRWKLTGEELAWIREDFWAAVTLLESKKEVRRFMTHFLTPSERTMFAKRFQIIMMLVDEVPYEGIRQVLHVSPDTISTVMGKMEEDEGKVLAEIAGRILELRQQKRAARDRQPGRRSMPGDIGTPLIKEGAKGLARAWFGVRKGTSARE